MPALFALALTLQIGVQATPKTDSTPGQISAGIRVGGRRTSRIPLTPEHVRTAYKTPTARGLVERARVTRMAQAISWRLALSRLDGLRFQFLKARTWPGRHRGWRCHARAALAWCPA